MRTGSSPLLQEKKGSRREPLLTQNPLPLGKEVGKIRRLVQRERQRWEGAPGHVCERDAGSGITEINH